MNTKNENNQINFDDFCKAISSIVTGANYDPRREMYFIDPDTIKPERWVDSKGYFLPKAIAAICPHCHIPTGFPLESTTFTQVTEVAANIKSLCPLCGKPVDFFAIGCIQVTNTSTPNKRCKSIWMLPKPLEKRKILIDENLVNADIFGAYEESINLFNARFWRGSVTECGRALEGISQDLFDSKELETIYKLGKDQNIDSNIPKALFLPIINLTLAIRAGRTSGAHLNYTKTADMEIASKMLDLTEYALRYFYEMPLALKTIKSLIKLPEDPA